MYRDNVFYFNGHKKELIDFRTCPKNASTSIKELYIKSLNQVERDKYLTYRKTRAHEPLNWRQRLIWFYADQFDMPFRKNSIRFAIRRDPIDRFKSAVEMLQSQSKIEKVDPEINVDGFDKSYKGYSSVKEVLDKLESNEIVNVHFWTQTYYMGHPSQYDYVYDISEMNACLVHLDNFISPIDHQLDKYPMHLQMSNNSSDEDLAKIESEEFNHKLRLNTHDNFMKISEEEKITRQMTSMDYARVRRLYKIDYDNGWGIPANVYR